MTPIQKLEAEYVNWDALPDWVRCVTADSEGLVMGWENEAQQCLSAIKGTDHWYVGGDRYPIAFRYDMTDINWRDCKWQRPDTNTRT